MYDHIIHISIIPQDEINHQWNLHISNEVRLGPFLLNDHDDNVA